MFAECLVLILLAHASHANDSLLFEDDSVLKASLTGPLGSLFEDVNGRKEFQFTFRATGAEHAIKVRLRGKSRRRECDFPPLRLNFASDDATQTIFEGQDKLKLVTHCLDRKSSQIDTLQEYAAYRIFNLISDIGYKVRLLHITYTDTDGILEEETSDRYGFLIESSSELANRVGAQPLNETGVSLRSLDDKQEAAVYVFQYLIGNTDWSLVTADEDDTCCHNGDLFEIDSVRYYVPYDFDLSGLVNTRYARPDPSLRISKVTKRLYRGFCVPTDQLRDALDIVNSRRAEILDVIRQLPEVSQRDTEATTKYVEKFFVRASDEDKLVRSFERSCL